MIVQPPTVARAVVEQKTDQSGKGLGEVVCRRLGTTNFGMVADMFGTSTARHARLPTGSARLRLAMQLTTCSAAAPQLKCDGRTV
ncbi:unnamed protein product [Heligmosomoides polygyrus]|uniref:Transposase n=1 Tax=Heligmosomoides polygyrus TaxID=6339 RepID=A0A183FK26_HELPZ|nr:unnamed protein product [Heligmosomoides polygyrus]